MGNQPSDEDMDEEYILTVQYPYRYFFKVTTNPSLYISIILIFVFPMVVILRKIRLPLGDRVVMLVISLFYLYYYNNPYFLKINGFIYALPIHKLTWLVPLLQFKNLFLLELYVIKKARYEIGIMAIVGNLLVVLGTCLTLSKLVLEDTSMVSCVLFATVLTCVEGCDSFNRIKQMERNKHLLIILETEALLGYTLILTCFHVVMLTFQGALDSFPSQAFFVIQYLLGGFLCGLVLGKIAGWSLAQVYNDSHNALIVCLTFTYLSYAMSEYVLNVSGPMVSFIVCLCLSTERKKLTAEAVLFIRHFVEIITYASTIAVFVLCFSRLCYRAMFFYTAETLVSVAFSYCFIIVIRMASLLLLYPLLHRVGYEMDLAACTFYGWAGASKGPITLVLAQVAYRNHNSAESFDIALPHVIITVILSIFINYSTYTLLLNKLGFFTMSPMRRGNMQNCVDYLNTRKWTLLTILKMASRLMTDTNYPIVYKYTVIKNPYKGWGSKDDDEDEETLINEFGLRESKCPWCNRDISLEPTAHEKVDSLKEARLRLLKTQKMAFIQQYELGMLSKDAVRFLLHLVEAAMESQDLYIKLDDFYKIFSTKGFFYHTKKLAEYLHGTIVTKVPKNRFRKMCYRIVTNVIFECFMFVCIILVTIPFISRFISPEFYERYLTFIYTASFTFLLLFMAEIVLKVFAFSSESLYSGIKIYFRSKWNILDFCVVTVHLFTMCLMSATILHRGHKSTFQNIASTFNGIFKLMRLFRFLRVVSVSWISKCNHKINSRISFGYDIGKIIVITYSDLAESLYQISENPDNVAYIKNQLDKDRDTVNITLEDVVKLKPSVPVQVKTRQAIRSTLNHMRVTAIELKNLGYADTLEFDQIMSRLYERNRAAKSLGKIKPSSPKALFMQLSFMIPDDPVTEVLFSQVEIVNWVAGTLILNDLDDAAGIFILLHGVLRITYLPHQRVVDDLIMHGMLPVVDFVSPFRADVPVEEFIFPGNSFGELAVLTQRKYNCTIQADTKCKALFLSTANVLEALKASCDPVQGLGARLWKYVVMDFATGILRTTPGYQNISLEQIRMTIDRSFVPNLQHYKTFTVTDLMEDLLLLEGLAADANNGDVYVAPCYLPRTVQKLILYSDAEIDMIVKVIPKLLIIPMKDVDEYEIMERVEDMVELIEDPPSYLLVRNYRKKRMKAKKKRGGGGLIGLSKRRRQIDASMMQARSRTLSQSNTVRSDPSMKSESITYKSSRESGSDRTSNDSTGSEPSSVAISHVTYLGDSDESKSTQTTDYTADHLMEISEEFADVAIQESFSFTVIKQKISDGPRVVVPILDDIVDYALDDIDKKAEQFALQPKYSWEFDKLGKVISKQPELSDDFDASSLAPVFEFKPSSYYSEADIINAGVGKVRWEPIIDAEEPSSPQNEQEGEAEEEVVTDDEFFDQMVRQLQFDDGEKTILSVSEEYFKEIIEEMFNTVVPKVIVERSVSETFNVQETSSVSTTRVEKVEEFDSANEIDGAIEQLLPALISEFTEEADVNISRDVPENEITEETRSDRRHSDVEGQHVSYSDQKESSLDAAEGIEISSIETEMVSVVEQVQENFEKLDTTHDTIIEDLSKLSATEIEMSTSTKALPDVQNMQEIDENKMEETIDSVVLQGETIPSMGFIEEQIKDHLILKDLSITIGQDSEKDKLVDAENQSARDDQGTDNISKKSALVKEGETNELLTTKDVLSKSAAVDSSKSKPRQPSKNSPANKKATQKFAGKKNQLAPIDNVAMRPRTTESIDSDIKQKESSIKEEVQQSAEISEHESMRFGETPRPVPIAEVEDVEDNIYVPPAEFSVNLDWIQKVPQSTKRSKEKTKRKIKEQKHVIDTKPNVEAVIEEDVLQQIYQDEADLDNKELVSENTVELNEKFESAAEVVAEIKGSTIKEQSASPKEMPVPTVITTKGSKNEAKNKNKDLKVLKKYERSKGAAQPIKTFQEQRTELAAKEEIASAEEMPMPTVITPKGSKNEERKKGKDLTEIKKHVRSEDAVQTIQTYQEELTESASKDETTSAEGMPIPTVITPKGSKNEERKKGKDLKEIKEHERSKGAAQPIKIFQEQRTELAAKEEIASAERMLMPTVITPKGSKNEERKKGKDLKEIKKHVRSEDAVQPIETFQEELTESASKDETTSAKETEVPAVITSEEEKKNDMKKHKVSKAVKKQEPVIKDKKQEDTTFEKTKQPKKQLTEKSQRGEKSGYKRSSLSHEMNLREVLERSHESEDETILELPLAFKPENISIASSTAFSLKDYGPHSDARGVPLDSSVSVKGNKSEPAPAELTNIMLRSFEAKDSDTSTISAIDAALYKSMRELGVDYSANMKPSTSKEPDEQSVDREKKHRSKHGNDKERKRREKESSWATNLQSISEPYELKDDYDIFSSMALNKLTKANKESKGSNQKRTSSDIKSKSMKDSHMKSFDSDHKSGGNLISNLRERSKSLASPSRVLFTREDSIIKAKLVSDDQARLIYLERTQKRLEEQSRKMLAEKEQNQLPKRRQESIGSLSSNIDLDLERKIFMWKMKDTHDYGSKQDGLPPQLASSSKSMSRKKRKQIEGSGQSSLADYDVAPNTKKYDRSLEKTVPEDKLHAMRGISIEEQVKSENNNEKQKNVHKKLPTIAEQTSAKRITQQVDASLPTSRKNSMNIVDDDDKKAQKATKRKHSNTSPSTSKPGSSLYVGLTHPTKDSKGKHITSFDASRWGKIDDNSQAKLKDMRRASIAIPEASVHVEQAPEEQLFDFTKYFSRSATTYTRKPPEPKQLDDISTVPSESVPPKTKSEKKNK